MIFGVFSYGPDSVLALCVRCRDKRQRDRQGRVLARWALSGFFAAALPAQAAPITFNTALPVAKGEYVFRQQLRIARSGDDSSELNRKMTNIAAISVLGYGLNARLAVFAALPYADNSLDVTLAGNRMRRKEQGFGDVSGFARYTFWQDNAKGRTFRLAGFGGLTLPVGDDRASDRLGLLPPPLQTGSGSWNAIGGLIATWQTLNNQFDGQISYRENREAHRLERGDQTRLDLSWQHRLWPRQLSAGTPGFLYGVLELNGLHQGYNRLNGIDDQNTGGDTLWASPGLQYVTRRWVIEAVIQKPISQNRNGTALKNDSIVTTSFRLNF